MTLFCSAAIWSGSRWWNPKCYGAGVGRSWKACTFYTHGPLPSSTGTWSVTTSSSQVQQAVWKLATWAWPHLREPLLQRASLVRYQCNTSMRESNPDRISFSFEATILTCSKQINTEVLAAVRPVLQVHSSNTIHIWKDFVLIVGGIKEFIVLGRHELYISKF